MPAPVLTMAAVMTCPHGGHVQPIPSNPRLMIGGAPVLTVGDTYAVIGCAFVVVLKPQPCVMVRWISGATRMTANGVPVLTQASVGICFSADQIPAGPPIIASPGQTRLLAD